VVVIESWHSDVHPGALGTVVKKMAKGYAVEIRLASQQPPERNRHPRGGR
jgi:hypothetical protein